MRKRLATALMVLALLYALTLTALAAGPNGTLSVQLYSWSQHTYTPASAEVVKLTLNGEALEGDVPAMIRDGRTLVPVRLVGEALQAQVLWVQQTGQVILTGGEDVIVLTLDSATALVNGVPTPLPDGVPAQVISYGGADRTMIPLRFVSETLGAQVEWDQTTYTAHLTAELPETAPEPLEEEPETPAQEPEVPDGVTRITGMSWENGALTISADRSPNCKVTDLGDRVAIDFLNAALGEDFSLPVERFLGGNGGAVICNPNAPTGKALPLSEIRRIAEANPDAVVMVDEAYADFGAPSAVSLLKDYPNLVTVHTLSKSRSLAGMRIGYALGSPDLIAAVNCVKNSFNSYPLDRLALAAGVAAMEDVPYFEETRDKVKATRERTVQTLREMGFTVHDSCANFIFVSHPARSGKELQQGLRDRGVLVRWFDKPRIRDYLRVSIGTDTEMEAMCQACRDILKG